MVRFKIGDKVQVCDIVPDTRCREGIRRNPVTTGTIFRDVKPIKHRLNQLCYGVLTERASHVETIPCALLMPMEVNE